MSYILDALRRAEADRERERGQVPGLHTQAPSAGEAAAPAGPRRWAPWAGAGLLLAAGIGAGAWWAGGRGEAPAAPAAPAPMPAPVAPPAVSSQGAGATPAASTAAVVPPVVAPAPPPAASASPYLPPMPPVAAPPSVAVPVARAPSPAPVAPPAAEPAPDARIPRAADLPEALRRELPRLAISGSIYSDDPASRFVVINGDVAREGARLSPDLVLEEIRPRELVLRFKGQRYRLPV